MFLYITSLLQRRQDRVLGLLTKVGAITGLSIIVVGIRSSLLNCLNSNGAGAGRTCRGRGGISCFGAPRSVFRLLLARLSAIL